MARMLGRKLHSGTFKTKESRAGLVQVHSNNLNLLHGPRKKLDVRILSICGGLREQNSVLDMTSWDSCYTVSTFFLCSS